jgi:hypothetical protein
MRMPYDHHQRIAEVSDALIALFDKIPLNASVPETEYEELFEALAAVHIKIMGLFDSAIADNRTAYWWGFMTALRKAGREDLILKIQQFLQPYPEERAAQELVQTMLDLHGKTTHVH